MNVVTYNTKTQITKHFNSNEFKCPYCGISKISTDLVSKLEDLFDLFNVPNVYKGSFKDYIENAISALGSITGLTVGEEVVDRIFHE